MADEEVKESPLNLTKLQNGVVKIAPRAKRMVLKKL